MKLSAEDVDDLAGDYVLGLLSETEGQAVEAEMAQDADLAARVAALQDQLLPLDMSAAAVELPGDFAARLSALIAREPRIAPKTTPVPANLIQAPARNWRMLAAGLAVGLVAGLGGGFLRPLPEPVVVAVLVNEAGVAQAVIEDYGNDVVHVRFVADIDVPADSTIQAWTLPSVEMGPQSLGVVPETRPIQLQTGDLPQPAANQLYEITLEPLGGSPTGRPTGPILGKGLAALQI